jgi:hypothetical protein
MTARIWLAGFAVLAVAACTEVPTTPTTPDEGLLPQVPEGVLAIAAPDQDLTAVRIDPIDGCYFYRYNGPVETTFLPLRTSAGNPICSRTADVVAAATG